LFLWSSRSARPNNRVKRAGQTPRLNDRAKQSGRTATNRTIRQNRTGSAPLFRGRLRLARLAQQALDEGRTEDIAYFEPFYLKDFVVTTSKKSLF